MILERFYFFVFQLLFLLGVQTEPEYFHEVDSTALISPTQGHFGTIEDLFHLRARNVIMLDWDNTLLPHACLQLDGEEILMKPECAVDLPKYEKTVSRLLSKLKTIPRTEIFLVTNATLDWVEDTAEILLPSVREELKGIQLISARELFEDSYPYLGTRWKTFTLIRIFEELAPSPHPISLLSLGDSDCERQAVIHIKRTHPEITAKFIFIKEDSSLYQLQSQLSWINRNLESYLHQENSFGHRLNVPELDRFGAEITVHPDWIAHDP